MTLSIRNYIKCQIAALKAQLSGGSAYTAGDGLELTGSEFSVDGTVARTAAVQTLSNKTLYITNMGVVNDINNGLAVYRVEGVASAVNNIVFKNSAAGNSTSIFAEGTDTNISITLSGKGTGSVVLPKADLTATAFKLHSSAYVELTASRPATDADNGKVLWSDDASDITLTFPDTLAKPFGCSFIQKGAGAIVVAVSGANSLRNFDSHTKTAGQWASATIDIVGTDVLLIGRTA